MRSRSNDSQDKTVSILEQISQSDSRVKIIINARNFGFVRSSYYGLLQGTGDAVILVFADFQYPPELIVNFLEKWEEGYQVVKKIKDKSTNVKTKEGIYPEMRELGLSPGTQLFLKDVNITKEQGFGQFNLAGKWKKTYGGFQTKEP
ncbi:MULTISPECIES: glycosyltransferase [Microcystis]|uniref:glycosyltransferase n=1 Tax=Microcystis TaxID=1125 RepID=UPI0008FBE4A3|nr:glycosyltransferase [Microcystis aeruginosa]MDB9386803.1 glycosyltransferase [Microcystis aeruginosa CS-583]ROI04014.1 glycosyltransferase [Microcystis aeruginosa FACHB-524]